METKQSKWKQVGTIGDINFVEHNGGPVFIDEMGVYPPELEYVQNMPDGDAYVYRILLENLKLSPLGKLIPANYDSTWPHPVESYTEWFDEDLDKVADTCGITRQEIVDALISENPMARASAYGSLAAF